MVARLLFTVAVALGLSAAARAQPIGAPDDLKEFGQICFCAARVATPHRIVTMDNNGRILNLLRRPMTKKEIVAAGEPVLDSQLRTLLDWSLIAKDGKRYRTAFPVLGLAEMAALRGRLTPAAEAAAADIAPSLPILARELRRRDRSDSGHALLFSYILDGLVWREMEAAGKLPEMEIDVERPYWDGTFWMVYPKQDSMPGTNSFSDGPVEVRMMWTRPVLDMLNTASGRDDVKGWVALLGKSATGGPYPEAPAQTPFARALIIDERTGGPLFAEGEEIAERVAQAITATRLDDVIPNASDQQRILIATHEFIWLLLDRLANEPPFQPPAILRTGASSAEAVAPLLVVPISGDTPQ